VLATVVVLVLAAAGVLAAGARQGARPDGSDGNGGADAIAAVSDAAPAGRSGDGGGSGGSGGSGAAAGDVPTVQRPARPADAPVQLEVAPSPPVSVEIPKVGIASLLERLAMGDDGVLAAPEDYGTAGWFAAGPEPGQPGPAVIAGHVDSRSGPAVFYRLGELQPGDEVLVHREDGTTVTFRVDSVEEHPKDAFPTQAVYGPVPGPELRLITCAGDFDREAHAYRDNLVVYATAVSAA
jgi:hypothetical protein